MKTSAKTTIAILLLIAISVCYFLAQPSSSPQPHPKSSVPAAKYNTPDAILSAHPEIEEPADTSQREKDLAKLKSSWDIELSNFKKTKTITPRLEEFAAESLRLLGCSDYFGDLLEHVAGSNPQAPGYDRFTFLSLLQTTLRRQLRTDPEGGRRSIIALSRHPDLKQQWAFEAAKFCSDDEAREFGNALGGKVNAQAVILGYSFSSVKVKPKETLVAVANELVNGQKVSFVNVSDVLRDLVAFIPASANIAELEAALPSDAENSGVKWARANLLNKWASSDPTAAANYVLNNQDRLSPNYIASVVQPFFGEDLPRAIEWIQGFPAGPIRDVALTAGAKRITDDFPAEARELALLIDDEAVRKTTVRYVDGNDSYMNSNPPKSR